MHHERLSLGMHACACTAEQMHVTSDWHGQKLVPYGDWRSTSTWCLFNIRPLDSATIDTDIRQHRNKHVTFRNNFFVRHLPAAVVNGGGDRCWKWKEFKLWRARDLDLDLRSGHTAYRRASLIDLYLYTKSHWNRRNFVDGRTDVRTDIPTPLILLGRLLEVDLKRQLDSSSTFISKKDLIARLSFHFI